MSQRNTMYTCVLFLVVFFFFFFTDTVSSRNSTHLTYMTHDKVAGSSDNPYETIYSYYFGNEFVGSPFTIQSLLLTSDKLIDMSYLPQLTFRPKQIILE